MKTNKFIFNSAVALQALQTISKVMERRVAVPIVENYLFTVKDEVLTISGTDLVNMLKLSFHVEGKQADFSAVVPPSIVKYLQKINASEGPAPLTFTYDPETYSIELTDDCGRAKYSGENHIDFPIAPQTNIDAMETTSDLFKEFKDLLAYASGDQLRPAMNGIAFLNHEQQMYLSATDGHRVKVVNVNSDVSLCPNVVVPSHQYFIITPKVAKILSDFKFGKKAAGVIIRTCSQEVEEKTKYSSSNITRQFVSFSFRHDVYDVELTTRNIDERFPDVFNVIYAEDQIKTRYTVTDKKKFLNVLDRAMLFANKTTHQIRISLNGKNKISAEDLDFSNEYCVEVGGTYAGEPIEIGFNGEYLSEFINSFGDTFTLEFIAPNKCGTIRDGKSIALLMPVMLNQHV